MSKKSREFKKKTGYVPHQREEQQKKGKANSEVKNGKFIYEGNISVDALSRKLGISAANIIKLFFLKGIIMNINTILNDDQIAEICLENNFDFEKKEVEDPSDFSKSEPDMPENLVERSPVITIMGHVDHGKTTLIDYIRHSKVALGEAGGITQEIGAYQKEIKNKKVTFLDTPGHEAFTAMRARGAKIGDIAILVVAADDGVMPQTKEAIDHARAAKLPIIVAINKCDKPGANPEKVMSELAGLELTPEEWGGDTTVCKISAKNGKGIDELLENLLLHAEILELKANPKRLAEGTVIDSSLDRREGPKATLLVQNGTLHVGDCIVVGQYFCKVRRMINEHGKSLKEAGPSTPVSILGLSDVPVAGDLFRAFKSESEAKQIAAIRAQKALKNSGSTSISLSNAIMPGLTDENEIQVINLIVKVDTKGTQEAIEDKVTSMDLDTVKLKLIRCAIGDVTESDIVLAKASNSVIINFNVNTNPIALSTAKDMRIEIREYNIIYKLLEDLEAAMKGKLKPTYREEVFGRAIVRALFKSSKAGQIAGCYVLEGRIPNGSNVNIIRNNEVVEKTKLSSLKHVRDDIKEAKIQSECGLTISSNFQLEPEDIIEAWGLVEESTNGW